jgi:hypothetical protein
MTLTIRSVSASSSATRTRRVAGICAAVSTAVTAANSTDPSLTCRDTSLATGRKSTCHPEHSVNLRFAIRPPALGHELGFFQTLGFLHYSPLAMMAQRSHQRARSVRELVLSFVTVNDKGLFLSESGSGHTLTSLRRRRAIWQWEFPKDFSKPASPGLCFRWR